MSGTTCICVQVRSQHQGVLEGYDPLRSPVSYNDMYFPFLYIYRAMLDRDVPLRVDPFLLAMFLSTGGLVNTSATNPGIHWLTWRKHHKNMDPSFNGTGFPRPVINFLDDPDFMRPPGFLAKDFACSMSSVSSDSSRSISYTVRPRASMALRDNGILNLITSFNSATV